MQRPARFLAARSSCLNQLKQRGLPSDVGRFRCSSTSANDVNKKYSETLLLPKTTFPMRSDPEKSEVPFRVKTSEELYRWQWENNEGPLFVMHDGPPYANGDLHMGHALNKVLKDIISRFHMSLGRKVHYHPGWDCHGLPIENKALERLGKDPLSLPPTTVRDEARAFAHSQVDSQRDAFRKLGIMADWHNSKATYRTLDHDYEIRQLRVFQKMVENGLIYRDHRPVHYSPSSRSALAEAELEYQDDHVSHSVYVSFAVDIKAEGMSSVLHDILSGEQSVHLVVWTTTPWTMTANMGIAVHRELTYSVLRQTETGRVLIVSKDRIDALGEAVLGVTTPIAEVSGEELIGITYHPIFSNLSTAKPSSMPLRVLHASHVTAASGTGLVHCAPAHGAEDYLAFRTSNLLPPGAGTMLHHVDGAGMFDERVCEVLGDKGKELVGLEVLKAGGKKAVELLGEAGVLLKIQRIKHRYPYDWKTKQPIIVRATSQWFANLDKAKDESVAALQNVDFHPAVSRNRLESFIRSRSEWCISRQRVWGVPIPALYHAPTGRAVLSSESLEHILSVLDEKGVAHWWNGSVSDFVPASLRIEGEDIEQTWSKGMDTMDVWFDSGSSWSMLEPYAEGREHLADVCLEGSDQHRGWFQSQLLTAVGAAGQNEKRSPYGTLITHGMVLDQAGKKMSKSLGNIVSPMTIIEGGKDKKKQPAYGAEVLRLWASTVEYWRDMALGNVVLNQVNESLRKIRNSARFILGNIGDDASRKDFKPVTREQMGLAEKYVMHELFVLEQTALQGYTTYNFTKVVNSLNNFANISLSTFYFDITKDSLYADGKESVERRAVLTVLEQVLTTMTHVFGPILPHLAEEIHHTRQGNTDPAQGLSVFANRWKHLDSKWFDPIVESEMKNLLRLRATVLSLLEKARREKLIGRPAEADVDLILPVNASEAHGDFTALLQREGNALATLLTVSRVKIVELGSEDSLPWAYTDSVLIPGSKTEMSVRVRAAEGHKCPRCWTHTRYEEDVLCKRCATVTPI